MLLALSRPFLTYCDGCGFALFISGMPTVIVGSTGSVFIMTTTHRRHGQKPQNPFPSFLRVGQVFGFATIIAFFDLTRYVCCTALVFRTSLLLC